MINIHTTHFMNIVHIEYPIYYLIHITHVMNVFHTLHLMNTVHIAHSVNTIHTTRFMNIVHQIVLILYFIFIDFLQLNLQWSHQILPSFASSSFLLF